ncbi:tRNA pseudouridine synthase A isoform X1 [Macadamia integrifolia]|uniref:tRNA pseudouridine synthase A isoform X1 n=1 Tax=Macadamia integrifolia TaxID=60698 RepID=UPI001C4F56CE|nr:tRNA pseudouridine synthase A isoform X1 [Macadamia integrifolia]
MLTYARGNLITAIGRIQSSVMENQTEKTVYTHYNHTDPCKYARWTARESYQFMYTRPWQQVTDFYLNLVNGRFPCLNCLDLSYPRGLPPQTHPLQDLGQLDSHEGTELVNVYTKDRTGRWARATFKIILSYHGGSFDGWQKQPGLNTVQALVQRSLGRFVDERKAQQLKGRSLPVEGCALVAGRTDKGVTALRQVCSFYTWREDVKAQDVLDAINSAAPGKLCVTSVSKVSRIFHPNFSAKWRRYFYIFPFNDGEEKQCEGLKGDNENCSLGEIHERNGCDEYIGEEKGGCLIVNGEDELESAKKPRTFSISRVNQLLRQLEGKLLSYKVFARDTKASRSMGPPTECFIYHARAAEGRLPFQEEVNLTGTRVMCVELVANRFLRKMVRVLVATSIREAAAGAEDHALLDLMDATCRRATAPPAPPDGLCLVEVGYTEFNQENCLIR